MDPKILIAEAEKLVEKSKNFSGESQRQLVNKAIKIYDNLCNSSHFNIDIKLKVIISYLTHMPGEGKEMLIKWRDMLPFTGGTSKDKLVKLLSQICCSSMVDPHERSMTATTLYNHAYLNLCYSSFESIALDKSVLASYRVEACRYLFGSDDEENITKARACLLDIIRDYDLESEYRYNIIGSFISKTGISTYLNTMKIKVPYDEEFVYSLQIVFFNDNVNGIRERILSGQHILDMSCSSLEEKTMIGEFLLSTASNSSYEENIRADAADVVLRLGSKDQIEKARNIITSLGYSGLNGKKNLIDRVKTIYTNSQNVHDENITDSVAKFIEKMITTSTSANKPFHEIQNEIARLVKIKNPKGAEKYAAMKALNRVNIDTATFTKYKITISDILGHVWARIQEYKGDIKETLENRLVEELIEMGDTCSSGHSARFVNILATVDADLKISYESQIIANISGRMNARINALVDEDLKTSISLGMMPDASAEDKTSAKTFIISSLKELEKELEKEFVGDNYISQKEFNEHFVKAEKYWLELI